MFDDETSIARFLLCSNTIVFIVETGFANKIRPYVSHETMYLSLFYYLVANYASKRGSSASSRCVWACVTWTALCSISLVSLLSFFSNFRHSIVDCLVDDATGDARFCRFGGDRSRCESFVIAATRQTVQEGCVTFVLGPFMGTLYAIMVFVFRFVPCFFGGVHFAATFNEDRLFPPGTPSHDVSINNDPTPSLPPTTFYLASSLFLWSIFALEFSAGKHQDISSYTTLAAFGALVLVQLYRSRGKTSPEAEQILQQLQFVGSMVLTFYVYLDFLRNIVALVSTCATLVDYEVLSACQAGDEVCLETRNALSTTFFRQHDCPQLGDVHARHVYFYVCQALRFLFLAMVYPATMIYKNIQRDIAGRRSGKRNHMEESINATPVDELERLLRTAVERELEEKEGREHLGKRFDATGRADGN